MEMSAKINILYTDYVHSEEEAYPLNLLKTVWENDKTLIHDADCLLQRLFTCIGQTFSKSWPIFSFISDFLPFNEHCMPYNSVNIFTNFRFSQHGQLKKCMIKYE